jgi:hypothetical protein
MRRGHRRMLLAAALLTAIGAPAGAQSTDEPASGVWWQFKTRSGGVPTPPVVVDIPQGGLWLNSNPTGDQALSAVRFTVGSDALPQRLALRVRSNRSTPALAAVMCPAQKAWTPPAERPGPWEDRAVPDCGRGQIEGRLVDGKELVFDLASFGPGDDVDLVLTRTPGDAQSHLDATFEKPVAADLQLGSVVSAGSGFAGGNPSSNGSPNDVGASFDAGPAGSGFSAPSSAEFGGGPPGLPEAVGRSDDGGAVASPTGPAGRAVGAGRANAVQDAWDAARFTALAAFVVLCLWIAAILSRRLTAGSRSPGPSFTLYRGAPPA